MVCICLTVLGAIVAFSKAPSPKKDSTNISNQSSKTDKSNFDKTARSITDPDSLWVIVNKKYGLPASFTPELIVPKVRLRLSAKEEQMQINKTSEPAFVELFTSAQNDGVTLVFGSGYRSGSTQKQFYESYKVRDGQKLADTYSARPGHSEHQTGFSADIDSPNGICHLEICWETTPEGQWIKNNAHKFGFIIRYPKDKQNITGYQYEPWHIRFVGKELAQEIHQSNLTLEEFFNLPPAPNYD